MGVFDLSLFLFSISFWVSSIFIFSIFLRNTIESPMEVNYQDSDSIRLPVGTNWNDTNSVLGLGHASIGRDRVPCAAHRE